MCEQLFAKTKVVQKNLKSIKRTRKNYISKKKEIIRNGLARRRNVKMKKIRKILGEREKCKHVTCNKKLRKYKYKMV